MEAGIVVTIFFFLGVIAFSAVLFVIWVLWGVVRTLGIVAWRIFSAVFVGRRGAARTIEQKLADVLVCPNPRCRGESPTHARFCRRCGSEMPRVRHVFARRAAMW